EALHLARAAGVLSILNPAPAMPLPDDLLCLADLGVPNETESAWLTGEALTTLSAPESTARAWLHHGPRTAVWPLAPAGAWLWDGASAEHFPAVPVAAADTTGAGDAFIGSLAVFLAEGRPVHEAVRRANALAALSVTRAGAQSSFPSQAEANTFLDRLPPHN